MREKMSRPSSSVPNQCAWDGASRRTGRLIDAGSCGAIQGAKRAKITKMTTSTTPVAASGLWRAFPAILRRNEMEAVDMMDFKARLLCLEFVYRVCFHSGNVGRVAAPHARLNLHL